MCISIKLLSSQDQAAGLKTENTIHTDVHTRQSHAQNTSNRKFADSITGRNHCNHTVCLQPRVLSYNDVHITLHPATVAGYGQLE